MTYEDATSRCWLEVDLDAIRSNYQAALAMMHSSCRVIPVVKANAYGMNAVEVARLLKAEGARLFAVATSDEAEQLLDQIDGIAVLPMGLTGDGAMERLIRRGMPLCLYSQKSGERIVETAKRLGVPAKVHVKIDTGLHRLGLAPETAAELVEGFAKTGWIEVAGLFTHLAIHSAGMDKIQTSKLRQVHSALEMRGIKVEMLHAVDSIGMVRYPDEHMDAARVGAWLYGVSPSGAATKCRCVARFKARISQLRRVRRGELVGYDDDHPLERDSLLATVSAGYIDGTPRTGENWTVEVHGMRARVIGLACMDQLMIDVTDIANVAEGDEVIFAGSSICVEEYAQMGHFNRNEAWARIGRRVPRIFYENGRPVRICAEV